MYSSLLVIIILCGSIVQDVNSWGIVGHRLVSRLAQSQLNDEAFQWVKSLLPWYFFGNLTSVAVWADDILYPNTNPYGYPNWQWSRPLHYINTPSWNCNYDRLRDCVNDVCVAGALNNYSKRAIAADFDDIQHQEAIMFLVHYVGDVHQPLHVGFQEDRGGNSVRGKSLFLNSKQE
ncbi:unnamed protein product [Rotaria sp. Silwood2]|nr:unnamed protein product [Rotaria sp. Silwood2]